MQISIRNIVSAAKWIVAILIFLGSAVPAVNVFYGEIIIPRSVVSFFHLNVEGNLPTWYSAVSLLFCSLLLFFIYRFKKRQAERYILHWLGLAIGFLYMSIDEATSIHEMSGGTVRAILGTSRIFFYAWTIPAFGVVGIISLLYLRFLLHIPREIRIKFIWAAALFLGGSLGLETISGWIHQIPLESRGPAAYGLITWLEESLEMFGILVFMHGLADYFKTEIGRVHIEFKF